MRRFVTLGVVAASTLVFGVGLALAGHGAAASPASGNASCVGIGLSAHATNAPGEVKDELAELRAHTGEQGVGGFASEFSKLKLGSHEACEHGAP